MCRRIGPALDAGFFIFRFENFRTFRRARNALGGTQGRSSLTTEEAGKTRSISPRFQSGRIATRVVRKFCSRERIVERRIIRTKELPRKKQARRRRAG